MFSKTSTPLSTMNYSQKIKRVSELLSTCETIVVGAGAGLSASAGLLYTGERFERLFADYIKAYGLHDMYSAAFYPYPSEEALWGYWSLHIYHNRYAAVLNSTYDKLKKMVEDKNHFVITTNADHLFIQSGFDKERLFYTQGDYGLFQCSVPCHQKTYDNKKEIYEMVARQKNLKIPGELVPHCPRCGKVMTQNLRKDSTFVEDEGWHNAQNRYANFLQENQRKAVLYLELGIGGNTPGIIKYPFWQYVHQNKNAQYVCINLQEAAAPSEIIDRSVLLQEDIGSVLQDLATSKI